MSLTSQLITDVFPDLEKVEQLNKEAFPEEERVPLSEFLLYTDRICRLCLRYFQSKSFLHQLFCHYASLTQSWIRERNH